MANSKRAERAGGGYHVEIRKWQKNAPLKWKIVLLNDISSSGILFSSHEDLTLDDRIEFKITLPSDDDIHCWGKVCRVEDPPPLPEGSMGAPLFKIAVSFTEIEESMEKAVERFTQKHRILIERAERARRGFSASVRYDPDTLDWDVATLMDVSSSGLLFSCNKADAPRGDIQILLRTPSQEVFCLSEVVRNEEIPNPGRKGKSHICGVAVRFKSLGDEFKDLIDLFVKDFNRS